MVRFSIAREDIMKRGIAILNTQKLLVMAKDWAESDEGRRAIKSASDKVNSAESNLQKERKIDPKSLEDPITV